MTSQSATRCTILIVSWKRDDLLASCLESIRDAIPAHVRCVVVDNANLKSTSDVCGKHPFVKYVASETNLGFAGGNNLGLPHCDTEFVCLLNNDTVFRSDSISPLVDFLDKNPNAGVAQGTLRLPLYGNSLDDCGTFLKWYGIQEHRFFKEDAMPEKLNPTPVFAAKGAFMMVRREAIINAGGFLFYDHFKSYYEETDFCHRVWLSGMEVWFVPTPPVDHLLGATSSGMNNARIWRTYLRNIFFSFEVNFNLEGKLRILVPFTLVYTAYVMIKLFSGRLSHFVAAIHVPADIIRSRREIKAARAKVRRVRARTDRDLLAHVMPCGKSPK